ncbi:MAG: hypothetical protein A2161_10150 [Candidatus Schekmanbacteria bacterium RBG_13_48_7]|uniref:Response regulatory domain-containing protein n=1 Tax=Candidatus Schekmanbacteria bacterium RBG_13_48_7 TaxID=1817878 RepID=A0A1F7S0R4_9BACT|nr:MAG: hypothetical protein A2161_10150 [Candidatus Schekmanbacteria bacterium RBG_13_48_7]
MKEKKLQTGKKILVVDDDSVMRDVLKELLIGRGYYICLASNGEEALKVIEETEFDLVITDLKMPKMGGIELFDEMTRRSLKIPVIVLTGTPHELVRCAQKKRTFAGILTKPFDLKEFMSCVSTACGNSSEIQKAS